jgi:hypothetical protein
MIISLFTFKLCHNAVVACEFWGSRSYFRMSNERQCKDFPNAYTCSKKVHEECVVPRYHI